MIEFRNVHFRYETRPILTNLSFTIPSDESVIIMGASGSGKSTILRLILGLEYPQQGEVTVFGLNLKKMKEKDRREARKQIGMVFQDGALFDSLTVGENVGYYLFEHSKLPTAQIEERVIDMLGFVGLDSAEIIDKLPEQLSGGMQRRVAIGRALLSTDPKVMLYDEPTTGLDPAATETIIDLINKLNREKEVSTIVVTHHIADALHLAKRYMIIHRGELAYDGGIDGLRTSTDDRVVDFLVPFREALDRSVRAFGPTQTLRPT